MTVLRNFDDLCRAVSERMRQMPQPVTREAVQGDPEMGNLCRLLRVYFDAEWNPPDGVIGVGVISYAERKLLEAQHS